MVASMKRGASGLLRDNPDRDFWNCSDEPTLMMVLVTINDFQGALLRCSCGILAEWLSARTVAAELNQIVYVTTLTVIFGTATMNRH